MQRSHAGSAWPGNGGPVNSNSVMLAGVRNKKAFRSAAQFIVNGLSHLAESAGDRDRLTATMTPGDARTFTEHWQRDLIVVRAGEDGRTVTHIGEVSIPPDVSLPKNVIRIAYSDIQ